MATSIIHDVEAARRGEHSVRYPQEVSGDPRSEIRDQRSETTPTPACSQSAGPPDQPLGSTAAGSADRKPLQDCLGRRDNEAEKKEHRGNHAGSFPQGSRAMALGNISGRQHCEFLRWRLVGILPIPQKRVYRRRAGRYSSHDGVLGCRGQREQTEQGVCASLSECCHELPASPLVVGVPIGSTTTIRNVHKTPRERALASVFLIQKLGKRASHLVSISFGKTRQDGTPTAKTAAAHETQVSSSSLPVEQDKTPARAFCPAPDGPARFLEWPFDSDAMTPP